MDRGWNKRALSPIIDESDDESVSPRRRRRQFTTPIDFPRSSGGFSSRFRRSREVESPQGHRAAQSPQMSPIQSSGVDWCPEGEDENILKITSTPAFSPRTSASRGRGAGHLSPVPSYRRSMEDFAAGGPVMSTPPPLPKISGSPVVGNKLYSPMSSYSSVQEDEEETGSDSPSTESGPASDQIFYIENVLGEGEAVIRPSRIHNSPAMALNEQNMKVFSIEDASPGQHLVPDSVDEIYEDFFTIEEAPPDHDSWVEDNVSVFHRRLRIMEKMCYHDIQVLLRVLLSRRNVPNLNSSLRAARCARWLPSYFEEVGDEIGTGMFGVAYLMETKSGKLYILKKEVIPDYKFSHDMKRILSEKNSMMLAMEHPNMIQIKASWISLSTNKLRMYTAMEFADFGTLETYVIASRPGVDEVRRAFRNDPRAKTKCRTIMSSISKLEQRDEEFRFGFRCILMRFSREIADGVRFLHSKGITHNDLHEKNILIGKGFHIKIADFGQSKVNHPVYESFLFQDEASPSYDSSMEEHEYGLGELKPAHDKFIDLAMVRSLLQLLATGIDTDDIIKIREKTSQPYFDPLVKHDLFYDRFLFNYSQVLLILANANAYEPWVNELQQQLNFFCNKFGEPYNSYDPTNYILTIYGSDKFSAELESKMKITKRTRLFGDPDRDKKKRKRKVRVQDIEEEEKFRLVTGIGFLDESFLREVE